MWSGFLWQRMRDSNPRKRSQSPVCYRYTNPLCGYYYTHPAGKVKKFFPVLRKNFLILQYFSQYPGSYSTLLSQGKGRPFKTLCLM